VAADEAAGDYVFAGEPFRAAAADRTVVREAAVAGVPYRRWNVSPVPRETPNNQPKNEEGCGEEKGKNSSRGKVID